MTQGGGAGRRGIRNGKKEVKRSLCTDDTGIHIKKHQKSHTHQNNVRELIKGLWDQHTKINYVSVH